MHDVLAVPDLAPVDPANRFTVTHPSGFKGPAFDIDHLLLWGFTAGLLSRFLDLGGHTHRVGPVPRGAAAGPLHHRAPLVSGSVLLDAGLLVLLLRPTPCRATGRG